MNSELSTGSLALVIGGTTTTKHTGKVVTCMRRVSPGEEITNSLGDKYTFAGECPGWLVRYECWMFVAKAEHLMPFGECDEALEYVDEGVSPR